MLTAKTDQTGRMPRLIWVFIGRTCHFVGFVMRRLKFRNVTLSNYQESNFHEMILQIVISAFWCSFEIFRSDTSFHCQKTSSPKEDTNCEIKSKPLLCTYFCIVQRWVLTPCSFFCLNENWTAYENHVLAVFFFFFFFFVWMKTEQRTKIVIRHSQISRSTHCHICERTNHLPFDRR